ncbi:MAG: hypothetical protein Fur0035_00190 [Anaerolineales bacterium]
MNQKPGQLIPAQPGMLQELTFRAKLIFRLMGDWRVSPLVKLLPVAGLLYWLLPLPLDNLIPVVDDAALVWLTSYFFIELCPTDVIREYVKELSASNNAVVDEIRQGQPEPEEVIDGEVKEE